MFERKGKCNGQGRLCGGQEAQELHFILNSSHVSYIVKGIVKEQFPAFQTVFLRASPQTPTSSDLTMRPIY